MKDILEKIGKNNKLVYSLEDLKKIPPAMVFAMDIETHGEKKKVGDCPYYEGHGIFGVALANMHGDACFVVIDDGENYGGIPVVDFIAYMNETWMQLNRVCVFHNCKFDLGFLLQRGLDISKVKIRDTWILSSVKNKCAFKSNKLKDIVREQFKIDTASETEITSWLKEAETEDYGEIPAELIGPYACDDVRYTLLIFFELSKNIEKDEIAVHDLLLANMLHYINAEKKGIRVHLKALRDLVNRAGDLNKQAKKFIKERLGGTEIDIEDGQKMMKLLHSKELHSAPRNYYGEMKYVLDDEFLIATKNKLAVTYRRFMRRKFFIANCSAKKGRLYSRVWADDEGQAGIYPYFWPSVHAKGGIPQCKLPDLVDGVILDDIFRSVFTPRAGHKFVQVRFCNLPALIFATYLKDEDLEHAVRENRLLPYLSSRSETDWEAASLWLRMQFEGHGLGVFERRLKLADVKFKAPHGHFRIADAIERALNPNGGQLTFKQLKTSLQERFQGGEMFDRISRRVRPPEDKLWRAFSILQQSSVGGIIAKYLNVLCKLAYSTNSALVFAHKGEFLFEVPENDASFEVSAIKIIKERDIVCVQPIVLVSVQRTLWKETFVDAHDAAYREIF